MRIILSYIIALVLLVFKESNNSELILLSDKMLSETENTHHVSRKIARWYTWERDVFISDLPDWVVDSEHILIIEQRYTLLNPSVNYYAIVSNSSEIYSKTIPFVKHVRSKKRYKEIAQNAMHENVPSPEKTAALLHLAKVALSDTCASALDKFFEPNKYLDVFPSYYLWSIRQNNGKYFTLRYCYLGECMIIKQDYPYVIPED